MKRLVPALAAASAFALTACTSTPAVRSASITPSSLDPMNPQVSVVVGATGPYIIVNQEPIVITTKGMSVVTWHLVTKGYEFDKGKGISFDPKPLKGISGQVTGCKFVTSTEFACNNNNNGKGVHHYNIYLIGPAGPLKVDPSYVND